MSAISNHRRLNCLLNHLFSRRWKKTSKLRVTGLCEGNTPITGGFPSERASNAENVSICWHHHDNTLLRLTAATIPESCWVLVCRPWWEPAGYRARWGIPQGHTAVEIWGMNKDGKWIKMKKIGQGTLNFSFYLRQTHQCLHIHLQYLQCFSNEDNIVSHKATDMIYR